MEREAIRRAAALDRYWDAMLRGDTFSADTADIEAGDAAILDDLQARRSHAPLVPDLERGWRELLQRPELHALQGETRSLRKRMRTRQDAEEMTMVQTGALPNVRPPIGMNGRVDTPPGRGPSFRFPLATPLDGDPGSAYCGPAGHDPRRWARCVRRLASGIVRTVAWPLPSGDRCDAGALSLCVPLAFHGRV